MKVLAERDFLWAGKTKFAECPKHLPTISSIPDELAMNWEHPKTHLIPPPLFENSTTE